MRGPYVVKFSRGPLLWAAAAGAVVVLPFVLFACNSHELQEPTPMPVAESRQYREVNPIRDVDILFVVDNSNSMGQEQANLARNFPVFMQELQAVEGGLPNVHIGVVSSDMGAGVGTGATTCPQMGGDQGILANVRTKDLSSCGLDLARSRFIVADATGATNNFTGDVSGVFSCLAALGTGGCSFEHTLAAARAALTRPENEGFLRQNAYLAIILITDEDDCSAPPDTDLFSTSDPQAGWSFRCAQNGHTCAGGRVQTQALSVPLEQCTATPSGTGLTPVSQFVNDIVALKEDPNHFIVAGIFGWPVGGAQAVGGTYRVSQGGTQFNLSAVCNSSNGNATPALRVKAFVESFQNHVVTSICQEDFREAMKTIGEKIKTVVGPTCVENELADADLSTKEREIDCQVTEKRAGAETVLPRCGAGGARPCWSPVDDAACAASRTRIDIMRDGEAPPGTQQVIKCLTCVKPGCV